MQTHIDYYDYSTLISINLPEPLAQVVHLMRDYHATHDTDEIEAFIPKLEEYVSSISTNTQAPYLQIPVSQRTSLYGFLIANALANDVTKGERLFWNTLRHGLLEPMKLTTLHKVVEYALSAEQ